MARRKTKQQVKPVPQKAVPVKGKVMVQHVISPGEPFISMKKVVARY